MTVPVTSSYFETACAVRLGSGHGGSVVDKGQAISEPAVHLLEVGAVDVVGSNPASTWATGIIR
jgi:hypothetical protein